MRAKGLLFLPVVSLLCAAGCAPEQPRGNTPEVDEARLRALIQASQYAPPLRRTPEVEIRTVESRFLEDALAAWERVPPLTARVTGRDPLLLTVTFASADEIEGYRGKYLQGMGFKLVEAHGRSMERAIPRANLDEFLIHLKTEWSMTGDLPGKWFFHQREDQGDGRKRYFEAGGVTGHLVYTGHPLDVAMPDAGPTGSGHQEFCLIGGPRPNERTRGGRVYVGQDGSLYVEGRVSLGPQVKRLPADAVAVRIEPTGHVFASLADGSRVPLGRLGMWRVEVNRDGSTGAKETATPVFPGDSGVPLLLVGHLEFPAESRMWRHTSQLTEVFRKLEVLRALIIALEEGVPSPAETSTGGRVEPGRPLESSTLVFASDLELSVTHARALKTTLEAAPGKVTLTVGKTPQEREQAAALLSQVLRGLLRRMSLSQQNYTNALKVRDDQGRLSPYRRRMIQLGKEGELLEVEDPEPFIRDFKPNNPDAGPDGFVVYPNVHRAIEQADFGRAREEYKLLRAGLERLAPSFIFPDPPLLQTEAKAP